MMKNKSDILIELLDYCCRGNCYKCRGCTIAEKCLTDGLYETVPCQCPCNSVCWSMVAVAHRMIDEGAW